MDGNLTGATPADLPMESPMNVELVVHKAHGDSVGSLPSALARFTRIVGVDTNSREHDGEKVCVTAVCELDDVRFKGQRWSGHVEPLWALEF
jgi:hypothetical protein